MVDNTILVTIDANVLNRGRRHRVLCLLEDALHCAVLIAEQVVVSGILEKELRVKFVLELNFWVLMRYSRLGPEV